MQPSQQLYIIHNDILKLIFLKNIIVAITTVIIFCIGFLIIS
jgi:hypothetical protein